MYKNKNKLIENINPVLEINNCFFIDFQIGKVKDSTVLRIFVDKEISLNINDCYILSKQIEQSLSESKLIDEYTIIEVSSPGVEKPLKFLKQYNKHIKRKFNLKYKMDDEIKQEEFVLEKIDEDVLIFNNSKEIKEIKFNNILEAKIILSFK